MKDKAIPNIDLNDDLPTIHKAKLKFHQEQIKLHQGQVNELLKLLKNGSNGHSAKVSEDTIDSKYFKQSFWEEYIPFLADKNFLNKEFGNGDLVSAANITGLDDDDTKRKVRYAVSMALSALAEEGILAWRKKKGIKGYLYTKA